MKGKTIEKIRTMSSDQHLTARILLLDHVCHQQQALEQPNSGSSTATKAGGTGNRWEWLLICDCDCT